MKANNFKFIAICHKQILSGYTDLRTKKDKVKLEITIQTEVTGTEGTKNSQSINIVAVIKRD